MRRKNRFISGDHNIISDLTGQKIKRSEAKFRWDGFLVEKTHWEPREAQLDVRGRAEDISVDDPRPRQETKFEAGLVQDDALLLEDGTSHLLLENGVVFPQSSIGILLLE